MITVTELYKSFPMGERTLPVLKGIDLPIPRGELIAIVGASGAGKSTMLHILGLLDRPTSGTVYFEGQDLFQLSEPPRPNFAINASASSFSFITCFRSLRRSRMPACPP